MQNTFFFRQFNNLFLFCIVVAVLFVFEILRVSNDIFNALSTAIPIQLADNRYTCGLNAQLTASVV